jgi:hypothetical protein
VDQPSTVELPHRDGMLALDFFVINKQMKKLIGMSKYFLYAIVVRPHDTKP